MPAGYSGTPLARKLGLKPGMRVRLLDPPHAYWGLFADAFRPTDVEVLDPGDPGPADFTHLFATELGRLQALLRQAVDGMADDGMAWASWPKKSSGIATEIGKMDVLREGRAVGLVDVKVAAVDETWSGHKFVIPVQDRTG